MYISQRDGNRRELPLRADVPENYGGNAFSALGYASDPDALGEAERAFRRGYVFEKDGADDHEPVGETAVTDEKISENETDGSAKAVHTNVRAQERAEHMSIFSRFLSTENLLLAALIFILWDSGADDELLLMVVILFFC